MISGYVIAAKFVKMLDMLITLYGTPVPKRRHVPTLMSVQPRKVLRTKQCNMQKFKEKRLDQYEKVLQGVVSLVRKESSVCD